MLHTRMVTTNQQTFHAHSAKDYGLYYSSPEHIHSNSSEKEITTTNNNTSGHQSACAIYKVYIKYILSKAYKDIRIYKVYKHIRV